jgi:hypothetical protein
MVLGPGWAPKYEVMMYLCRFDGFGGETRQKRPASDCKQRCPNTATRRDQCPMSGLPRTSDQIIRGGCSVSLTVNGHRPSRGAFGERGEVFVKPQPWLLDPNRSSSAPRSTPRPRRGKREPRRQRAATVTVEARPGPDAPIGRLFQPATWGGGAAQRACQVSEYDSLVTVDCVDARRRLALARDWPNQDAVVCFD